ncbi:aldo/keto reductase, partial [Thioclava sp. BHET1]
VPAGARGSKGNLLRDGDLNRQVLERVQALNGIAERRGQTLAQMAIAWTLRDPRVTSSLIGARTVEQLENSLGALNGLAFSEAELTEIDQYAKDGGTDFWKESASMGDS